MPLTIMSIPYDTPELVKTVESWLGAPPAKIESLYGQVRWTWTKINREQGIEVDKKWTEYEKSIEHQPNWYRMRHCVSCIFPADDVFIFSVILRNPEEDFWCLPPHAMKKHHAFKKLFCGECGWVHDHCKCSKVPV